MASPPSIALVVARWREDLAWLRRVPPAVALHVYDKGGDAADLLPPPLRRRVHLEVLPNAGREAHTYLHHLAHRYDRLADLTVFAQGRPFDHVPDLHRLLRRDLLRTGRRSISAICLFRLLNIRLLRVL